jgi:hypothetical protein
MRKDAAELAGRGRGPRWTPRNLGAAARLYNQAMEVVLWGALAGGGTFLVYWVLSAWRSDARRTRRVLRRAKVSRIADLADGRLACIVGVIERDGPPLEALISRRPCVAFDTTLQYFRGADFTIPARVEVTRRMVPFFVSDATGRVRVDAAQAALCNRPIARSERFEERILEDGARVRLVGSVTLEPAITAAGERGFRDGALKATITGTARYPLLVDVEEPR